MKMNDELTKWVIEQRRYLHQHPEVSYKETETRIYIKEQLEKLNIETYSLTGKDVIGRIKGTHAGKTIGIRADLDALPIFEETGLPFVSKNEGVMHACGHDGHMAILLGTANYLSNNRDAIHGTIVLIFQHAEEEIPGGATELVSANLLEGVDAIFGYHLWQPLESGVIGMRDGATMAGADRFTFKILGKGGHGSMPDQTIDPTLVISHVITQLHSIVSRSLSPQEQAVLSIGKLNSGTNYNIIPDTAEASGTVRFFSQATSKFIRQRIESILKGVCESFGAKYELNYEHGDPPLINDQELTVFMNKEAIQLVGEEKVIQIEPILGSEDFAYYSVEIPACYLFIGIGNPDRPYGHHHPKFDIDEDMLSVGVELFSNSLINFLKGES
ncbi:M20 family metallopeptidase [Sporosarcina siberiensis]|uniref:M20 family metallopeptidase n=1 Tax=Sporosarcina siberiensis TaxID=1365606 RepID=A0ABW4SJS7_9BACL